MPGFMASSIGWFRGTWKQKKNGCVRKFTLAATIQPLAPHTLSRARLIRTRHWRVIFSWPVVGGARGWRGRRR